MVLASFFLSPLTAQNEYQYGILPTLNINKALVNGWKINFKTESRQQFGRGIFDDEREEGYEYLLTDFALLTSRKIQFNTTIAGGYQIRFRAGKIIHRTIQQLVYRQAYSNFRVAYRLSTDQTFTLNEDTEFRFRFRVSSEFPLSGTGVDIKEFYLKVNNEYLNAFEGETYDLEIRLVPVLGFQMADNIKIESGLDYRLDSFVAGDHRQRWWGVIASYFSF